MRTRRQRMTTAAVVLAVLTTGVAFVCVAWIETFPGDPDIDCKRYAFPTRQWRAALGPRLGDEAATRQLARNVVRCRLVLARTPRAVRAVLGPPTSTAIDGNPRPHRDWSYDVGLARNILDEKPVSLHLEIDRGRVVYVRAPGRDPGESGHDITAGAPVGGGPVSTRP